MDTAYLGSLHEKLKLPVLFGAGWLLLAGLYMSIAELGGAVNLLWLPNGFAVGTLFLTPRRRWAGILVALQIVGTIVNHAVGLSLTAASGIALANVAEAAVAAALARRFSKGRNLSLQTIAQMRGFALAAFAGALSSAIIALGFRYDTISLYSFSWWLITVMLGTLIATPIYLHLYRRLTARLSDWSGRQLFRHAAGVVLTTLAMYVLSILVLSISSMQLLVLPMAMTLLAVVRHGFLGATTAVLAFALAGTTVSFGGGSPAAFLEMGRYSAGFVLQLFMLLQIGCSIPLAALLVRHGKLAGSLERRNSRLAETNKMLSLAEEISGFGRWHFEFQSGRHTISSRMSDLLGFGDTGHGQLREIRAALPDGGRRLIRELNRHRGTRSTFAFNQIVLLADQTERMLRIHATNEFAPGGGKRSALFAVAMDISDQVKRERALDMARKAALELAGEAQKLANTDALTGLANRRCTLTHLRNLIQVTQQTGEELSAIVFDLDHFKQINDCFGHQMGDRVLVHIAHLARSTMREGDLIGRTGGEEFVWLLPSTNLETAMAVAERLRRTIERESSVNDMPRVTTSLGCAQWRKGDDGQGLLSRADMALYEAKDSGRNKVRQAA